MCCLTGTRFSIESRDDLTGRVDDVIGREVDCIECDLA